MKIDILIVDFAVVASVMIPYLILVVKGFNESKLKSKQFLQEAEKNHMNLDETDQWNMNIIGIDRQEQKLLLLQRQRKLVSVELIDLKKIRSCKIVSSTKPVKINEKAEEVLQRIDLELEYIQSGEKKYLNLYDCNSTYFQDYEIDHAIKWNQLINSCISYKPRLVNAA